MSVDDVASAIASVRHVIQEHAPPNFELGGPADLDGVRWLAHLLGWELPDAYLRMIQVYDGICAGLDTVLSSDQAFDTLRIFRDKWHGPHGYWPVGEDECGNYWVMNIRQQGEHPPGTVFFYDHEADCLEAVPTDLFATSYPAFVQALMQRSCDAVNCRGAQQETD